MFDTEYQIQAQWNDPPFNGQWINLSGVYDFMFGTMFDEEKARQTLKRVNEEYAPRSGNKYRLVMRKVTEWEVI